MPKLVLDVGNCGPDHGSIRQIVEGNFDAKVIQAHAESDALQALRDNSISLVLVNRRLDRDDSEGIEIIRRIKSDADLDQTPVMMITNFEDHQALAIKAGAEPGFGKLTLASNETLGKLAPFLS